MQQKIIFDFLLLTNNVEINQSKLKNFYQCCGGLDIIVQNQKIITKRRGLGLEERVL